MEFLTLEPDAFTYGVGAEIVPGVTRVIAQNPSKFTYHGTGTYIVGDREVAVIDPGPMVDSHRDALAATLSGRTVRAILITHCHADHSPLAAWLAAESGAPSFAFGPHGAGADAWDIGALPDDFGRPDPADQPEPPVEVEESTDTAFVPDVEVRTGDTVFATNGLEMTAIHTPGHTSNHTCFALESAEAGRVLFTGDHVMGWSTTVVSPPDGDMGDYLESLRAVAGRNDDVAIPTHGPPILSPRRFVDDLVEHRLERERQALAAVRRGRSSIPDMVTELYASVRIELHRPAGASVLGHLVKLVADGVVEIEGGGSARLDARYRPV